MTAKTETTQAERTPEPRDLGLRKHYRMTKLGEPLKACEISAAVMSHKG